MQESKDNLNEMGQSFYSIVSENKTCNCGQLHILITYLPTYSVILQTVFWNVWKGIISYIKKSHLFAICVFLIEHISFLLQNYECGLCVGNNV